MSYEKPTGVETISLERTTGWDHVIRQASVDWGPCYKKGRLACWGGAILVQMLAYLLHNNTLPCFFRDAFPSTKKETESAVL